MNCKLCGREMQPAPARWDGEPTYVGYMPCACDKPISTEYGIVYPGSPEHDVLLESGRCSVNDLLEPIRSK